MEDVLQVPVSRGYLAKLCTGTISAALADAYGELTEAIPQALIWQERALFGLTPPY